MIEKNEIDGGTTSVDGRPMRIVLDANGVHKRIEEMKAPAKQKPSALDEASDTARRSQPAALELHPDQKAPAGGATPEGKGTGSFKAPL